jgi:hypothetical protein
LKRRLLASSVLALGLMLGTTAGASAATPEIAGPDVSSGTVSPDGLCSGSRVVYRTANSSITFTRASQSNASVTGNGGVTIGISTSTTFTVSGSITTTADVTLSAVVGSVKSSMGVTIGASRSGTTSNSGSWTVPTSWQIGRLEIGSNKYAGTTTKYLENSNCVLVKMGTAATYNAPAQEWHFKTSRVA